jgi:hypothetical protein
MNAMAHRRQARFRYVEHDRLAFGLVQNLPERGCRNDVGADRLGAVGAGLELLEAVAADQAVWNEGQTAPI